MALQGPHKVAQKSVTTMREEERTEDMCEGEVMDTVLLLGGAAMLAVWW